MDFVLTLLAAFAIKHFIADYLLQGNWMLGKFREKGWVLPLAAHAAVHAAFTFVITYVALDYFGIPGVRAGMVLGAFDFIVHFVMDRIKASPKLLGRFKAIDGEEYKSLTRLAGMATWPNVHPEIANAALQAQKTLERKMRSNRYFWWSLGFDQTVHHLTDLVVAITIVNIVVGF